MNAKHVPGRRGGFFILAGLVMFALASPASAQTPKKGTVEHIKVHGAALEGNLQGESPDRDVFIYLPPGYAANRNQRYPVVYLLHGYGLTGERWMDFTKLSDAADKDIAAGTMKDMIFVSPDGYTKHGGSMWSSSPTIGDWETYVAEDLVSYVDKNYRTIANRNSRGLGGHSMGGYGTLRIGMKRPDVFSSLYPMSACCLIDANLTSGNRGRGAGPGAGPGTGPGAAAGPRAGAPAVANAAPPATPPPAAVATAAPAGAGPGAGAGRGAGAAAGRGGRGGGFGDVQSGLAAAWAPNPKNPPNFFDTPVKDGEQQPLVIAKYAANSPFAMLPQYVTNLKKYKTIKLDCGEQDTLFAQNKQLVDWMETLGVPHVWETYQGDHTNHVVERIEQSVLPFFSQNLAFSESKKK